MRVTYKFPSPGGDYGLSDELPFLAELGPDQSFRPLAGITVFRTGHSKYAERYRSEFPSPGGDYGLSDEKVTEAHELALSGFRPLAGITVFRTSSEYMPACNL